MIKKYNNFIFESKYQEIESEYHSIGEYVEKVSKDNEYLIGIISNYINDFDVDIRISNAVNLLDDFDKKQLFYRIFNYLNRGEKDKEADVMTNVIIENVNTSSIKAGRNVFVSFLKCITALGLKDISKSESTPDGYLFFYKSRKIDVTSIKPILNRFRSISMYTNLIDYTYNECSLYYGIKYDTTFEYGFHSDKNIPIGYFKLNKSNLNWLLLLQSPSSISLKKDLVSMDDKTLLLFGRISSEMNGYNLNQQSKSGPNIKDDIITFGYQGIGKWNNGQLENSDYETLKSNFKNWILKHKWSKNVLFNISSGSFWVFFNIKAK